jgi:hypothetical protein
VASEQNDPTIIIVAFAESLHREHVSRPQHVLRTGSTMFHAMDCPGCVNTPFTASPRSESYWCN